MKRRYVAVNENGRRIGETHPRSTISDERVDYIRGLHEDNGWSYERISRKTGIPVFTIAKLCRYERRNQTAEKWVLVE